MAIVVSRLLPLVKSLRIAGVSKTHLQFPVPAQTSPIFVINRTREVGGEAEVSIATVFYVLELLGLFAVFLTGSWI